MTFPFEIPLCVRFVRYPSIIQSMAQCPPLSNLLSVSSVCIVDTPVCPTVCAPCLFGCLYPASPPPASWHCFCMFSRHALGPTVCAPCLFGCLCPLCTASHPLSWLPVPSVCSVDSVPVGACLTDSLSSVCPAVCAPCFCLSGCLCPLYVPQCVSFMGIWCFCYRSLYFWFTSGIHPLFIR